MAGETPLTVIGNVVRDAELKYTPSGSAVATFTVASTPRTLDRASGEWKDGEAMFLRCTVWRDMAEHCAETLTKGMRVIVTGRLRQENWEDRNGGGKRSAFVLDVDEVGPSLKFAQAQVTRAGGEPARSGGRSSGSTRPADLDEPPF